MHKATQKLVTSDLKTSKSIKQNYLNLPLIGMSRWNQFKAFIPFSKEKFRQLSIEGKAPQPIRMGLRCTFYSNQELHRFLENPLEYLVHKPIPTDNRVSKVDSHK